MNEKLKRRADLTVKSFAYVAGKLAQSSDPAAFTGLYEQILAEAEKHRSALRLMQRDIAEHAYNGLRSKAFTEARAQRILDMAAATIAHGQDAITRVASQYAPQRMAA